MILRDSLYKYYTTDVIRARLQLTTTIDFSNKTATQSQKKSSNLRSENIGEHNQILSNKYRSLGNAMKIGSCNGTSTLNSVKGRGSDLFL